MSEIYDAGEFGVSIAMIANEGTVTMTTVSAIGGDSTKPSFSAPIKKGDFVKITGDMTVSKCAANDTACIGYAKANPVFVDAEPTTSGAWGSYKPRKVSIALFATKVKTIPLEAANTAISVGDSVTLGATTAQKWDKDSTPNSTVALQAAQASSGAKIAVAFGVYRL